MLGMFELLAIPGLIKLAILAGSILSLLASGRSSNEQTRNLLTGVAIVLGIVGILALLRP